MARRWNSFNLTKLSQGPEALQVAHSCAALELHLVRSPHGGWPTGSTPRSAGRRAQSLPEQGVQSEGTGGRASQIQDVCMERRIIYIYDISCGRCCGLYTELFAPKCKDESNRGTTDMPCGTCAVFQAEEEQREEEHHLATEASKADRSDHQSHRSVKGYIMLYTLRS